MKAMKAFGITLGLVLAGIICGAWLKEDANEFRSETGALYQPNNGCLIGMRHRTLEQVENDFNFCLEKDRQFKALYGE